jgi:hypothetical protein
VLVHARRDVVLKVGVPGWYSEMLSRPRLRLNLKVGGKAKR